jgi:hypothetical protein
MALCPLLVGLSNELGEVCQKNHESSKDDGLFVDDIEFLRDGRCEKTSSQNNTTSLSNERAAGNGVNESVGTLCGRWT